jgi:hypothetical protein
MVQTTQDDKDRATEAIERIAAAPADPSAGPPEVTSSTDVAHGIIAETVAGAREDASQGGVELAEVERQLAGCQANTATMREKHQDTVKGLKAQLRRAMKEDEDDDELLAQIARLEGELAKVTEYAQYAQPRVNVFNHMAQGLVATNEIIAQDQATRAAREAAQADVVEAVADEAASE